MKITIDVSPAVNGKAGLGRYAAATAAHLAAQQPIHLFANLTPAARWPEALTDLPRTTLRVGYKPWRMAVLLAQMVGLGWDRRLPPTDVFHATEHLLLPLRRTPTVLTVHDLIFKRFPQHHKRLNYTFLNIAMPLFARRADHIIAVSQATKRDLMAYYDLPPEKISVVYEAAAPHFTPPPPEAIQRVRAAYALPDHYLITVGTIEPRKNLPRAVEALAYLRTDHPDLRLVVVGAKGWLYDDFFAAIEHFDQREAVILPGYVPDSDLPAMIGGASAALQISLAEGFGLPVLEAMACGTPLVCSSTTSMGEVAADAALTVEPTDVEAITAALHTLLTDADRRADYRQRGLARAAEFSWQRAARETLAVYRRTIT